MALTITADGGQVNGGIRVVVAGSDLAGLQVWRRTPISAGAWEVRALVLIDTATRWDGVDFEAPFDLPCEYWATTGTETSATASASLPSGGRDWLRSVAMSALSHPIDIERFDELERDLAAEEHRPLGGSAPVVVIDARLTDTGALELLTWTEEDASRLHTFLAESVLALLGGPPANGWREGMYVRLGKYTHRRIGSATEPARRFAIDVLEVERPDVTVGYAGTWTWQDHLDAGHTWAHWRDMTWLEVLFGKGGAPPPSTLASKRRAPVGGYL
jgi:hypothetical protein